MVIIYLPLRVGIRIKCLERCQTHSKHSTTDIVVPPYLRVPHQWIQPTVDGKCSKKKCYVVDDVYYVVRPMIIAYLLNMYDTDFLVSVLFLPSTIQCNKDLCSIYIALL